MREFAWIQKRTAYLVAICSVLLAAAPVRALDAYVVWSSVADAAGYKLYVRQAGGEYAAPIDVGSGTAEEDGNISYLASGLGPAVTNYFAITSYDTAGTESPFSNELALPGLCALDCQGDGAVDVDDLMTAVNIILGITDISACPSADPGNTHQLTVTELLAGLNAALNGCGQSS